jgi:hypothetical protein
LLPKATPLQFWRAVSQTSTLNHTKQNNDHSYHQQQVDEASHRVSADHSEQPDHDKDKGNGSQHVMSPKVTD